MYRSAFDAWRFNEPICLPLSSMRSVARARFFSTRLNLNIFTYLLLKLSRNKVFLDNFYEKLLNSYQKNYLENWEKKPIVKVNIPFGKRKRIVFEIRREKDRA